MYNWQPQKYCNLQLIFLMNAPADLTHLSIVDILNFLARSSVSHPLRLAVGEMWEQIQSLTGPHKQTYTLGQFKVTT